MKFSIYSCSTCQFGAPVAPFILQRGGEEYRYSHSRFTPLTTRSIRAIVFVENFLVSVPYLSSECSIRHSNGELSQIKKSFTANVLSHSQASSGNLDICLLELHPLSDSSHYALCVCWKAADTWTERAI